MYNPFRVIIKQLTSDSYGFYNCENMIAIIGGTDDGRYKIDAPFIDGICVFDDPYTAFDVLDGSMFKMLEFLGYDEIQYSGTYYFE